MEKQKFIAEVYSETNIMNTYNILDVQDEFKIKVCTATEFHDTGKLDYRMSGSLSFTLQEIIEIEAAVKVVSQARLNILTERILSKLSLEKLTELSLLIQSKIRNY